jgi:hypothetical protein
MKARPIPPMSKCDVDRFWAKVKRGKPDECWLWTAYCDKNGYGRFSLRCGEKRVIFRAHRVANAVGNGDTSSDATHSCDNPPCCNPSHLKPGTQQTNMAEMDAKGRRAPVELTTRQGEQHGRHVLTERQVRKARAQYRTGRFRQIDLAEIYGVSRSAIRDALVGKSWRFL